MAKTAMSSLKESEEQTSPPATPGSRGVQVASSHFSKTRAKRGNNGCLPGSGTQREREGVGRGGKKSSNQQVFFKCTYTHGHTATLCSLSVLLRAAQGTIPPRNKIHFFFFPFIFFSLSEIANGQAASHVQSPELRTKVTSTHTPGAPNTLTQAGSSSAGNLPLFATA